MPVVPFAPLCRAVALTVALALALAPAVAFAAAPASAVALDPARAVGARMAAGVVDTSRVVLRVQGLYCTSCERTVTAMLMRTPGVVRAQVSAKRGETVVLYDPARTSAPKLVAVLERLGYRATVTPPVAAAGKPA